MACPSRAAAGDGALRCAPGLDGWSRHIPAMQPPNLAGMTVTQAVVMTSGLVIAEPTLGILPLRLPTATPIDQFGVAFILRPSSPRALLRLTRPLTGGPARDNDAVGADRLTRAKCGPPAEILETPSFSPSWGCRTWSARFICVAWPPCWRGSSDGSATSDLTAADLWPTSARCYCDVSRGVSCEMSATGAPGRRRREAPVPWPPGLRPRECRCRTRRSAVCC